MPAFNRRRDMNENIAKVIIAVARGIAWIVEQIIKRK